MASSNGASAGSTYSLLEKMDQRKRKRMISNRESARRSRQRKQKHLDELNAQVNQLRKENGQIVNAISITTQHYLGVEAENSVLRTRMMELTTRLQSLNEILSCVNEVCDDGMRPWSLLGGSSQPKMASVDMYQYS